LVLFACTGTGGEHADEVVFRAGASDGLSELIPGALDGTAAAAADLVFECCEPYVASARADGAKVLLTRKRSARLSASQLASAARYKGLISARALDADHVELVLRDPADAAQIEARCGVCFDVGPFAVESQESKKTRLRRRGNSAIDVIEIVAVSSSDEWRKLLARELDVMSSSPSLYRDQFAGMTSVRLLDIPPTISATLFFNVRDPELADRGVRRQLAASLNRAAIARVATDDPSAAALAIAAIPGKAVALPTQLSLLVIEDQSTLILAASVIRHQFARLGITVGVEPMALADLLKDRVDQGRFQLVLMPAPNGDRRFARFVSPGPEMPSITGFADPEYDAAVRAGDLHGAQSILDREMPATVLYEWRTFAAIDAHFCGEVTPSFSSWRWMADLHPCEDGEREGATTP